ncbi:hypothetical protein GGI07_005768 [Coemansia sp. Benny D115]|nr:hypothetical protein GGI07_005768 [Coemansia sp. Benny D115]
MVRSANSQPRIRSDGAVLANWYTSQPPVTKLLLTSVVMCTLATSLNIVSGYYMPLYWPAIWKKFHVWRLVTGFVTTHVSLNELITMVMLYYYSVDLERIEFGGRQADYAWFLIFCMGAMASVSWLTLTSQLYYGVYLAVITLWSQYRSEQIVNFFMGIKFPAKYLPYMTMGLTYVLNHGQLPSIYSMLYGFGAAHLYYYLSFDLPSHGGLNYIPTPQLVYRMFGRPRRVNVRVSSAGADSTVSDTLRRTAGGHFWGTGRSLG